MKCCVLFMCFFRVQQALKSSTSIELFPLSFLNTSSSARIRIGFAVHFWRTTFCSSKPNLKVVFDGRSHGPRSLFTIGLQDRFKVPSHVLTRRYAVVQSVDKTMVVFFAPEILTEWLLLRRGSQSLAASCGGGSVQMKDP